MKSQSPHALPLAAAVLRALDQGLLTVYQAHEHKVVELTRLRTAVSTNAADLLRIGCLPGYWSVVVQTMEPCLHERAAPFLSSNATTIERKVLNFQLRLPRKHQLRLLF